MAKLYLARFLVPVATPAIEGGALAVESGRIVGVGSAEKIQKAFPGSKIRDFGDAILVPPLVNAHTHLELTAFPHWEKTSTRSKKTTSFVEWIKQVVTIKRQLSDKDYRASLKAGLSRSLASGTGAVGDTLSRPAIRDVYRSAPVLGRIFYETLGVEPQRTSLSLENLERLLHEGAVGELLPGTSPHAPYSLNKEFLSHVIVQSRNLKRPLSIHLAETSEEVLFVERAVGPLAEDLYPFAGLEAFIPAPRKMRPVEYLSSVGGLGPDTLVVHGVHVSAEEVRILAESGATVVLCCRSNSRFGPARPPVREYLAAGVPLALGTDSLASVDTLSVWDELAFAREWLRGQASPEQLLEIATRGGAGALGLTGEMGEFSTGAGAHFQLLRCEHLPRLHELTDFLCTPGRTKDVERLYLNGLKICYN